MAARLKVSAKLSCVLCSLGERGALESEQTAEHGEEWSSAGEERGGKKLTTLI